MTADRPAWVDALRSGETRTWRSFRGTDRDAVADPAGIASAGQLELVRRLALGDPGGPDARLPAFDRLADLVLATPPAGRGPVDTPVQGAATSRWGTPDVEPDTLPAAELLRVAVPVLARLLPGPPPPAPAGSTPWRGRRFVVHGAPGTAAAVAAALTAAGWVHGPFRATHVVLGHPLDVAVEQVWDRRIGAGAVRGWRRTWRLMRARDSLPAPVDPAFLAARAAADLPPRRRASRLHVVVAADAPTAVAAALGALGVHTTAPITPVDPPTVDLRRRLNALAGSSALDTALLDRIAPQAVVPLGVPAAHRTWAVARGTRHAAALATAAEAGDYAVHGDPAVLAQLRPMDLPRRVDPAETLARALAAIGAVWRGEQSATSERTHP